MSGTQAGNRENVIDEGGQRIAERFKQHVGEERPAEPHSGDNQSKPSNSPDDSDGAPHEFNGSADARIRLTPWFGQDKPDWPPRIRNCLNSLIGH